MKLKTLIVVLLLCIALFAAYAVAEDASSSTGTPETKTTATTDNDDDDEDDEASVEDEKAEEEAAKEAEGGAASEFVTSSPDCEPSYIFPDNPDGKFELGRTADIVLGFTNKGKQSYKVQYIRGYLVSPMDWSYTIQNFTGFLYNVSVLPGETSTMLYRFRPDAMLEARDWGVVIDVYYLTDKNTTFATSFFNSTINLIEPVEAFDASTFFAYVSILGMFALIGFGIYKLLLSSSYTKKLLKTGGAKGPGLSAVDSTGAVDYESVPEHVRKLLEAEEDRKKKKAQKEKNA